MKYDMFEMGPKDMKVVLKRIYNSSDKIVDVLKEVKILLLILTLIYCPSRILCKFTKSFN